MHYIKQLALILVVTVTGEWMYHLLPLPIPASIYGLLLMLALLFTGTVKVEQVQDTSRFLIEIMPLMFIVPAVGLLNSWDALAAVLLPFTLIVVSTTVAVLLVSGRITDAVMKKGEKK